MQCLSSTDVKCQWSCLKEPSLQQYKPVPLEQFCCYKIMEHTSTLKMKGDVVRYKLEKYLPITKKLLLISFIYC